MFIKTKVFLLAIILTVFGLLVSATLNMPDNLDPKDSDFNSLEYPPNIEASVNGCGSIFYFRILDIWQGTVPEEYIKEIPEAPMNLPAYGYMDSKPFDTGQIGVYLKNFEGFTTPIILRALWDGIDIIWYNPEITDANYSEMENIVSQRIQRGEQIMLLPFTIEDKQIPLNRNFAMSSWGVTQSCLIFDEGVYDSFVKFNDTVYSERDKINPQVAPLDENGNLREILTLGN